MRVLWRIYPRPGWENLPGWASARVNQQTDRLDLVSVSPTDTKRDLCFTSIRDGQCFNPSNQVVTKSICCCTQDEKQAVGVGWGSPCMPCPRMETLEYKRLCPHGPGMDLNGGGKPRPLTWPAFSPLSAVSPQISMNVPSIQISAWTELARILPKVTCAGVTKDTRWTVLERCAQVRDYAY